MRAFGVDLGDLVVAHVLLGVLPVVAGLAIALPLGWWAHRSPVARAIVVPLGGALFTIPSLALVVAMPLIIGAGFLSPLNVAVPLTLYVAVLLVRTVAEGLDAVPATVTTAAVATGYRPLGLLVGVQLPLAVPVLTAGVRVASVTSFSLATVGSLVGIESLGDLLTVGFQRSYPEAILAGIVGVLVLAFVADLVWTGVGRMLTPWARAGR